MTKSPNTTSRRERIGGNLPPKVSFTMQECEDLAKTAFSEVDLVEKLNQTSVQEMAAACMGYHSNLTRPPELGYYTMPNQMKAHDAIWTSMFDFFLPKETRVASPAQGKPDLAAERAYAIYRRRYTLLQRGVELASWLSRSHVTLDSFNQELGLWEVPLLSFCKDGYTPDAEEGYVSTLMNGDRWFATRKARKATKTQAAVTGDLDKFNASVTQFIAACVERAKPKVVAPPAANDTTPATSPATGSAVAAMQASGAPLVHGASDGERDTRLPHVAAASQTIAGWCNAVIKELRSTDNGKLVYPTLKTLDDADRDALTLLVKVYDEMRNRANGDKSMPAVRAETKAA